MFGCDLLECHTDQIDLLTYYIHTDFRNSLLRALGEFQNIKEGGMFINSCFIHCQTWAAEIWHSAKSPRINDRVGKFLLSEMCCGDGSGFLVY